MNRSNEERQKEYLECLQLTKQYILQESNVLENGGQQNKRWIVTDFETYHIFKDYAIRNGPKPSQPAKVSHLQKTAEVSNKSVDQNVSKQVDEPKIQFQVAQPENEAKNKPLILDQIQLNKFEQEPLKPAPTHDLTDIKKLIHELFPRQIILNELPTDDPVVIIITGHANKKEELFLANLAKAIDIRLNTCKTLTPGKFLEKPHFPKLKMIIRTDPTFQFSKEGLRDVELFDTEKFLREPGKKAELWKMIENGLLS